MCQNLPTENLVEIEVTETKGRKFDKINLGTEDDHEHEYFLNVI